MPHKETPRRVVGRVGGPRGVASGKPGANHNNHYIWRHQLVLGGVLLTSRKGGTRVVFHEGAQVTFLARVPVKTWFRARLGGLALHCILHGARTRADSSQCTLRNLTCILT